MFLVWGSRWEYKVKDYGLRVNKNCPECDRHATFYEVVPTKYFTLFWIPIVSTEKTKPLLECPLCHASFYIQQSDYANDIDALKQHYEKIRNSQHDDHHAVGNNGIVKCESCGQKLRIPIKEELLKITCPSCKNNFLFQNGEKQ